MPGTREIKLVRYSNSYQDLVEEQLSNAITQVFSEATAANPVVEIGRRLIASQSKAEQLVLPSAAPLELQTSSDESNRAGQWNLVSWVQGAGIHRVVAAAMQQHSRGDGPDATLAYVKSLPGRDALAARAECA